MYAQVHIHIYTHSHLLTLISVALINVKGETPLFSHLEFGCVVAAARFLDKGLGLGAMEPLPWSPEDLLLLRWLCRSGQALDYKDWHEFYH